jgi:hypothetical protein
MDHERGAFKVKRLVLAWFRIAVRKIRAVKIANMTKICLSNIPFADDACIGAVQQLSSDRGFVLVQPKFNSKTIDLSPLSTVAWFLRFR